MQYQINGEEPKIIGKQCGGLYLVQHQEGESITDPATYDHVFKSYSKIWCAKESSNAL